MNVELMKQRRKELNLRQQDLADKCGLSKTTIFNYENRLFEPKLEHLERLACVLDVDIIDLATDSCVIKDNNYYKRIYELENAFYHKVMVWFENRYKNSTTVDYSVLAGCVVKMINNLAGKRVLYSSEFDRVIFCGSENISCSFDVIELYLTTLTVTTETLNNMTGKKLTENTFINLINSSNSFKLG